jgi:hypothetical protein
MKNIRYEIADRLNFEFGRRGLSFSRLNGKREIKFDEITNVFNAHVRGGT